MVSRSMQMDASAVSLALWMSVLSFGCSSPDGSPNGVQGGSGGSSSGGSAGSGGGAAGQGGSGAVGSLPIGGAGAIPGLADDEDEAGSGGTGGSSASNEGELPERVAAYVSRERATLLRIEIDAVAGLWPYASSKSYVADFYAELLDKPDGVEVVEDETLAPIDEDTEWTITELAALAQEHASEEEPGTISIQVLALPGHYSTEDGGTVLGVAWAHRFIALFQDSLRQNCEGGLLGGFQQEACEVAERNVWAHEIGHVIGLVDNGIPMQTDHRDPEHGRHDRNEGCLMYWAYDRPQVFDTLLDRLGSGEGSDLDLCQESRADVEAARAR